MRIRMFDSLLALTLSLFSPSIVSAEILEEKTWSEKTAFEVQEQVESEPYLSKEELLTVSDGTLYWVVAVLDGDTLLVSDSDRELFQVRLLAVDTNEINGPDSTAECFGVEAAEFTLNFLKNRAVLLTADPANQDEDPFGRKLRYVDVLQEDGSTTRLNDALLREGMAFFPDEYPVTDPEAFQALESQAQSQELGLWGAC